MFRRFVKQVFLGADITGQSHDQLFAYRVDGRVSDLRKALFEIIEEALGLIGKHGGRRISPHRSGRLLSGFHHRGNDIFDILPGVSIQQMHFMKSVCIHGHRDIALDVEIVEVDPVQFYPEPVGLAGVNGAFDLIVGDDASLFHVD